MKQIIITILCLMFFTGVISGQSVWVSNFSGAWDGGTKVSTGHTVTWTINIDTPSEGLIGSTNGFRVYIADNPPYNILNPGPGFMPIISSTIADFSNYDTYVGTPFGVDGFGADTVGFGGVSFDTLLFLFNQPAWSITTMVDTTASGNYLCIDTAWFPPGGVWMWGLAGGGSVVPTWGGPYCYLIEELPCLMGSGDLDLNGHIFVSDIIYAVDYLFNGSEAPACLMAGDINCDGLILVDDIAHLVRYLYKGGPPPPGCR